MLYIQDPLSPPAGLSMQSATKVSSALVARGAKRELEKLLYMRDLMPEAREGHHFKPSVRIVLVSPDGG